MTHAVLVRYDDDRIGIVVGEATYDVCDGHEALTGAAAAAHVNGCITRAAGSVADLAAGAADGRLRAVEPRMLRSPTRPVNVFGAPVNYEEHRGELGSRSPAAGTVRDLGLFVKAPGSVSGPDEPIILPLLRGREFHYEGEIAVVIGRAAEDVPPAAAMSYVAGFTGALDMTMRLEDDRREERSMRKSYRTFTPMGPALLPLTEGGMATTLALELSVNGEVRQHGDLGQLIMPVADLVALASSIVVLQPGDVILTGTPSGVGPLVEGDAVRLTVSGLPPLELAVTNKASDATVTT